MNVKEFAKVIYDMSEDVCYEILERFGNNQNVDKTITYVFMKAYYLHSVRLYLSSRCRNDLFNEIYEEYKSYLSEYYKINNKGISDDLLNDIIESFVKMIEMLETMGFKEINDSYEFRHYTILCFDVLRKILENKSKNEIRQDLFENCISKFKNTAEDIIFYVEKTIK